MQVKIRGGDLFQNVGSQMAKSDGLKYFVRNSEPLRCTPFSNFFTCTVRPIDLYYRCFTCFHVHDNFISTIYSLYSKLKSFIRTKPVILLKLSLKNLVDVLAPRQPQDRRLCWRIMLYRTLDIFRDTPRRLLLIRQLDCQQWPWKRLVGLCVCGLY